MTRPDLTAGLPLPCYGPDLVKAIAEATAAFELEHGAIPKRVLVDTALISGKRHIIINVRGQPS